MNLLLSAILTAPAFAMGFEDEQLDTCNADDLSFLRDQADGLARKLKHLNRFGHEVSSEELDEEELDVRITDSDFDLSDEKLGLPRIPRRRKRSPEEEAKALATRNRQSLLLYFQHDPDDSNMVNEGRFLELIATHGVNNPINDLGWTPVHFVSSLHEMETEMGSRDLKPTEIKARMTYFEHVMCAASAPDLFARTKNGHNAFDIAFLFTPPCEREYALDLLCSVLRKSDPVMARIMKAHCALQLLGFQYSERRSGFLGSHFNTEYLETMVRDRVLSLGVLMKHKVLVHRFGFKQSIQEKIYDMAQRHPTSEILYLLSRHVPDAPEAKEPVCV